MFKRRIIFGAAAALLSLSFVVYLMMNEAAKPELIRNLPSSTYEQIDAEFRSRVQQKYPSPLSKQALMDNLEQAGFTVVYAGGKTNFAVYEENAIVCKNQWRIIWDEDGEQALNLRTQIKSSCL